METNKGLYISIIVLLMAMLIAQAIAITLWDKPESAPVTIKVIHRHYNFDIVLPDEGDTSTIENHYLYEYTTSNITTVNEQPVEEDEPQEETIQPEIPDTPEEIELDENVLYAYFYKDEELYPVECCSKEDLQVETLSNALERVMNFLLQGSTEYQTYIPDGVTYAYIGMDYSGNFKMLFSDDILKLKGTPEASLAIKQIKATANWAYKIIGSGTLKLQYLTRIDGRLVSIESALGLEE